MWFNKKVVEVVDSSPVEEDEEETPTPVPVATEYSEQPTEEYYEMCKKLGVITIPVLVGRLGLRIYDSEEVKNYLNEKFIRWLWYPLRAADVVQGFDTEIIYKKPVPFAVLKTVESILAECPTMKFFISDESRKSDEKDPFLLITNDNGHTRFIIERWDEPSFR